MLIEHMLPITLAEEVAATKSLWHPSWMAKDEFHLNGLEGAALTDALVRRIFLLTGGVMRYMFERRKEEVLAKCLTEPQPDSDSPLLAVLSLLYTANRLELDLKADEAADEAAAVTGASVATIQSVRENASSSDSFDPFHQVNVSMDQMQNAASTGEGKDHLSEESIRKLADDGWFLLSDHQYGTFLRPKYFDLMESIKDNLTLLERAAIQFPESRLPTLAKRWMVFYVEHLMDTYTADANCMVRWFDSNRPRHLELFHHHQPHTENFFITNAGVVFKLLPDNIGFGE